MATKRALTPAQARKVVRELERIQRQMEALADELEDAFQRAMVRAQARAYDRIATIIAEGPDFSSVSQRQRIEWWLQHQSAVEEALVTSGYNNAVAGYVAKLPQFTQFVEASMVAQGERFIEFPKGTLDFLRQRSTNAFVSLGTKANAALTDALYSEVFVGTPKGDALALLKGQIEGTYSRGAGKAPGLYEWHAGTYARTNHFRYVAELDAAQADLHGIQQFMYSGPVDEKNRPFCRKLLATTPPIFTREQIAAMDNGHNASGKNPEMADVFTARGGWGCRHRWIGASNRLVEKLMDVHGVSG